MARITSYFIWTKKDVCGIDFWHEASPEPVRWAPMSSGGVADIISMIRAGEVHYHADGYLFLRAASSQPLIAELTNPLQYQ